MNNDPAGTVDSFWRSLDVKVRYPGLCRLNDWCVLLFASWVWMLAVLVTIFRVFLRSHPIGTRQSIMRVCQHEDFS